MTAEPSAPGAGEERPETPAERLERRRAEDARSQEAARARIAQQHTWVDLQVRQAIERGEFDRLPGQGKPIADLGAEHDPDWWVRRLLEREQVTGLAPPSVLLRREDAALDESLDRLGDPDTVRSAVAAFNERVRWALYRPEAGPPVVTPQRDPDREVERWAARRAARVEAARLARAERAAQQEAGRDRRTGGRSWRQRLRLRRRPS